MILATDIDRTLVPDGNAPYDGSLPRLLQKVQENNIILVYVSGRNCALLKQALTEYSIPVPDYFIGSVGTEIYKKEGEDLREYTLWQQELQRTNPDWDRNALISRIGEKDGLSLQEDAVQNEYKISFYVDMPDRQADYVKYVSDKLTSLHMKATILSSIDVERQKGLIDVVPENATKLGAMEFLRQELGVQKSDMIYAGDSGNDILVLASCYKGILVKNAPDNVKKEVMEKRSAGQCPNTIYIAEGKNGFNGNYSSGILEGLEHFGVI